jgi:hypothetical protein
MRIDLTPGQAVTIHGWLGVRTYLTWSDVLGNPTCTFAFLTSIGICENKLYVLQPDLQAWVRSERASLADCPRMKLWDAHPIRDFKADLADIIRATWPAEVMARMNVTYDDLIELGLTPGTMTLFNYTLMDWTNIGIRRHHIERIPASLVFQLFDMTVTAVLSAVPPSRPESFPAKGRE